MSEPKTVRVRIAVVIDAAGKWGSAGWIREAGAQVNDLDCEMCATDGLAAAKRHHLVWVEADVPLPPEPPVIEGQSSERAHDC